MTASSPLPSSLRTLVLAPPSPLLPDPPARALADAPGKNDKVCAAVSDVREDLSQCVQMLQKMTRWIHLMVPAIEDGNNFGVGVQVQIYPDPKMHQKPPLLLFRPIALRRSLDPKNKLKNNHSVLRGAAFGCATGRPRVPCVPR